MLDKFILDKIIKNALEEDLGWGDVTTESVLIRDEQVNGNFIAKQEGVVCGIQVCKRVFQILDESIKFEIFKNDGARVIYGDIVANISGSAKSILKGERVALNLLQRMGGIATTTNKYVEKLNGLNTKIVDTRKTAPGLRILDKYSVKIGGGFNHRFNLSDLILIKDNHIKAAGGITTAISNAKSNIAHAVKIEIEVESHEMLKEAIEAGADIVMLDNMNLEQMAKAVEIAKGKVVLEASGDIELEGERNVRSVAETGVDIISSGYLTDSVTAMDISLRFI